MGFIMDGLESEAYDRNYPDRELVRRVLAYFKPHVRKLLLVAAAITLNSLAATGGPILVARGLDLVQVNSSNQVIFLLTAGVLLLGLSAWVFNFIQQWFSARVVGDVVLQIRKDVFDATIRHDMSFFDEHPSGKIVSRVTSDTQDLSDVVTLTTSLMSQILLVLILSVVLLSISAPLTVLLIALTPIAVVIALSFRRIARSVTQQARRATAKINALIQESISGIMIAKGFRQEDAVYQEFREGNEQAYQIGLRRSLTFETIFPLLGASSGIGSAIILFAGGVAAQRGMLTPGNWYLFMQAVGFFWWPLISIASFWSQFQDGLSSAERVFALIDAEPKVVQMAAEPVGKLEGGVTFRDVRFTYVPEEGAARSDEIVLPDFSLAIRPRETLALVGHTGAGKSSVGKLGRSTSFRGAN
jgi:ABC-type multidrug transport system fused ATPase/permease subunit